MGKSVLNTQQQGVSFMTVEKKSKRQARREKMRKQEMRGRLTTIGLITAGALLLVIAFIWPQFTTIDDRTA
jgi:uncharacterized DUF497 family protein